ncbi:MAG: hypothetical protein ACRDS0_18560 [Pseudonocardiaceae bacterium]
MADYEAIRDTLLGIDHRPGVTTAEHLAEPHRVDMTEITRLDHLRALLPDSRAPLPRLLVFSRSGFTSDVQRVAADRQDVELVDLERLYRGD